MKNQDKEESSADNSEISDDESFDGEDEFKFKSEILLNKYKIDGDYKIHKLNEHLNENKEYIIFN
jgi:hypothetical protein